jgi:hypothetical protein
LFQQFFNGTSNHRTDEYGGSIENKAHIFWSFRRYKRSPEEKLSSF